MKVTALAPWQGSKRTMAPRIVELLGPHRAYVEPFMGSCAVLLAKPPCSFELVNDLHGDLTSLSWVIQHPFWGAQLYRRLRRCLFSESHFAACKKQLDNYPLPESPEKVGADAAERAYCYFVLCWMGRSGVIGTANHNNVFTLRYTCNGGNQATRFAAAVDSIPAWRRRLRSVTILRRDGLKLLERLSDEPGQAVYCLPAGSLVRMADEQLVPIEKVNPNDRVAPGRTVLGVMQRWHDGPLLHIGVQGLPDILRLTPEHNLYRIPKRFHVRQEKRTDEALWSVRTLEAASSLQVGDYLLVPIGGAEEEPSWPEPTIMDRRGKPHKRPLRLRLSPELFRLLGYYAAEGHCSRSRPTCMAACLSFGIHEMETLARDAAVCIESALGVRANVQPHRPHPTVATVRIDSTSAAKWLSSCIPGTATNKFLSDELMIAPTALQKELLIGWLRGDGGADSSSRNRFKLLGTSASEVLARQMFTIALRCGLRPSFKRRARNFDVYFASEDAERLGWETPARKFRSGRRIVNGHILARIRSLDTHSYSGRVYDLDVDGDDQFCAPFALVHNCDPPYLSKSAKYEHDFTDADHARLALLLSRFAKTRIVLSYYDAPELDALYPNWTKIDCSRAKHLAVQGRRGSKGAIAPEVLLVNQPATLNGDKHDC